MSQPISATRSIWFSMAARARPGSNSTIVGFEDGQPVLLRAGALARGEIEDVLGRALSEGATRAKPQAPGMLASHYAPRAQLRLDAREPQPGEAYLGFGAHWAGDGLNLSEGGNLREAAANLFAYLRRLDRSDVERIAVAPIPDEGLGEAINDRLRRAAAPRRTARS